MHVADSYVRKTLIRIVNAHFTTRLTTPLWLSRQISRNNKFFQRKLFECFAQNNSKGWSKSNKITVRHRNTYKSLCFSLLFFLRKTRGIGDLASYQSSPSSGSSPQPPSTIARSSIRSAIPSSPSPVSPGGTLRQPSYFQSTPKGWHPVTPPATSPISQQSIQPNWYNQQQQQNQQFQVSNRNIDVDLRQTDIYRYIYIYRYVLYNNNWNKYERTKCGIKFSFI